MLLVLGHEQPSRHDKSSTTNYLRRPKDTITKARRQDIQNSRKGCESADPEHSGTEQLTEAGDKSELVEVVGLQLNPRRTPDPRIVLRWLLLV